MPKNALDVVLLGHLSPGRGIAHRSEPGQGARTPPVCCLKPPASHLAGRDASLWSGAVCSGIKFVLGGARSNEDGVEWCDPALEGARLVLHRDKTEVAATHAP